MAIPFVIINLDKPRKLRFGMGAMVEFEQLTGVKITSLDEDNISMELLAKVLWVMLKNEDKELTFNDVLNLVDDNADDLSYIMETVTKAMQAAFGTETKQAKNA